MYHKPPRLAPVCDGVPLPEEHAAARRTSQAGGDLKRRHGKTHCCCLVCRSFWLARFTFQLSKFFLTRRSLQGPVPLPPAAAIVPLWTLGFGQRLRLLLARRSAELRCVSLFGWLLARQWCTRTYSRWRILLQLGNITCYETNTATDLTLPSSCPE
jgi:hypothetical protein